MKREAGNWTRFRSLPNVVECDFHHDGPRDVPYWEAMAGAEARAIEALQEAQASGKRFVLFTHGLSTPGPFKTTARSVVRGLMRSSKATPYIIRKDCIQHESVFVAAVRTKGDQQ